MNWPKIAFIAMLVLAAVGWGAPWVTGIEIDDWPAALRWAFVGGIILTFLVLGRDQMRKDKQAETWVGNPRKSKFQNWVDKRRQRFSLKRGVEFFFVGLVAFSIMVGISALSGELASFAGGVAFVLIMSLLAGLIGMFTEKVPL